VINLKVHEQSNKHRKNINQSLINIDYFNDLDTKRKYMKAKLCPICDVSVINLKVHEKSKKHRRNAILCEYENCRTGLNDMFKAYCYSNIKPIDPKVFIDGMRAIIENRVKEQKYNNLKLVLSLKVEFSKQSPDGETKTICSWFNSGMMTPITDTSLLGSIVTEMIQIIDEKIVKYTREGSGWIINKLLNFEIKIAKYKPLNASSYIETPKKFQNPHYKLINMQNRDNECFKWCIARSDCLDQKNPQRVSERVKIEAEKYNFENITFPVALKDIDKFENQNKLSINVYGFDEKEELYPLRITKMKKDKHVNLLLISNDETNHYIIMKDLSPFVNKNQQYKSHVCPYCLHCLDKQQSLETHEPNCSVHTPVRMELAEGPVKFQQYHKQIKHPFVIYADFESTLQKIHTVQPNPEDSYTINLQKHIPNSFSCLTKCEVDKHSKLECYHGLDSPKKFVKYLITEVNRIYKIMKINRPMNLSGEEKNTYFNAKVCYVCEKEFTDQDWKVRDHNHLTGAFRGAAHSKCNLKIRCPRYIPIIIHNLSGYDAHLFVKEFGQVEGQLRAIPQTDENYISFSQYIKVDDYEKDGNIYPINMELRFIDSFRFMSSSLEKLVSNLPNEDLKILSQCYKNEKFNLLRQKGVYPYDWMDDENKFNQDHLPNKNEFYNLLNNEHISDEKYKHAQLVWKTFNCKTFKDYHMLYLKSDSLLLSDVFENFRNTCMKTYGLDPAHYFTSPGLSWDALLKHTKIELELMKDPDMLLFIEKGIRGGISTITHRHAKANNPYIPESYDKSKPNSYITYLDTNNLYGWAMSQYLPTGKFKWIKKEFNLFDYSEESKKGCILEVDLEYPSELHDLHNDYPLAAENVVLDKVSKLVPNLNNKNKYIIHYRNLQQCLQLGLKLTKVHRVLEFNQSSWMKSYIDLNTDMRKVANNEFEKDFYKLMNNSVFGKTMENIRNRVDVQLVKNESQAQKLVNKPNFESFKIFSENLIACHMKKTKLRFDKPNYVGMSILEISKTLMYDFHYDHIKNKYNEKAQLLFTDTDSLCYCIHTKDVYADMKKNKHLFDTSNYPEQHKLYSAKNKKVLGKIKDETAGKPIVEFVGLRAKLYVFKTLENEEVKKAKGVKKQVIQQTINIEDYKRALFEKETIHRTMNTIQSTEHNLYTTQINKVALCGRDDKRHILENRINTLAIGHHKIRQ